MEAAISNTLGMELRVGDRIALENGRVVAGLRVDDDHAKVCATLYWDAPPAIVVTK